MQAIYFDNDIESNYLGHIMAEVWRDRVYDPYLIGRENLTIVDAGAHVGIFSMYARRFAKDQIAIEPDPEHFKALQANTEGYNIKLFNVAVADKEGEMDFYQNDNKTMYSLMPQISDPKHKPIKVKVMTLSEVLKDYEVVDFLKLDVEGKESDIIQSEDFIKVAPKIKEIVMEVHSWSGRHPNQMKEALKQNGFKVEIIPHQTTLWRAYRI